MSSLGGGFSPGVRPPWGWDREPPAGPGPAPAGTGKANSGPTLGRGLGGRVRAWEGCGSRVPAVAAPAGCPLAVLLPCAPCPSSSRCGTRCQVSRAAASSLSLGPCPRFSACVSRSLLGSSLSPISVPVPRVLSRCPSGDTTGGRLKPVDRSPGPLFPIILGLGPGKAPFAPQDSTLPLALPHQEQDQGCGTREEGHHLFFNQAALFLCDRSPGPLVATSPWLAATSPYSSSLQGLSLWCSRSSFLPVCPRSFAHGSFLSLLGICRL